MGFMWVCFEKMEHHEQSKTKCEIDLIQFSLTKNYIIKDETISAMEGEEKGEKVHTFLVSDDSDQVSDEIPFASLGSCEEERVSSLMRGRESLFIDRIFDSHNQCHNLIFTPGIFLGVCLQNKAARLSRFQPKRGSNTSKGSQNIVGAHFSRFGKV
jgi:hypothetical protein